MPKFIELTRGFRAIVDDADFDALSEFKWYATTNYKTRITYAARGTRVHLPDGKVTTHLTMMHNQIMGKNDGLRVDHISRDSLDNRRSNLRWATRAQNGMNTNRNPGITGFRGVYRRGRGFQAMIRVDGDLKHIGYFTDKIEAARAYDEKAAELRGAFAFANLENN